MKFRCVVSLCVLLLSSCDFATTLFGRFSNPHDNGFPLTMVTVPPGSYKRDAWYLSTITYSFRMSAREITRAQFAAVMGFDPSYTIWSSGTGDPAQNVNWYMAIAFCNKLSIAEGLQPVYSLSVGGKPVDFATITDLDIPVFQNADWDAVTATWTNNGYRLPTEIEWMWAAMGATSDRADGYTGTGTDTTGYLKGYAGSAESSGATAHIADFAWYKANDDLRTRPVGTKLPNELGIYDMSGNVWEWCWDWNGDQNWYPPANLVDYRGATTGTTRVNRGGAWDVDAAGTAITSRPVNDPSMQRVSVGFRIVLP